MACEKPLALTVEQAQEMLRHCRAAGVRLLVAHVVRFFPEYALAQAVVAAGQVGRLGVIRLLRGGYRPKKSAGNWFLDEVKSGGILMDLMIHDYDYACWVAGEVESVYAKRVTEQHIEATVDYGLVILSHKSGALSHISGAWAYPPPTFRTRLEIAGDQGLIEFDSDGTAPIQNDPEDRRLRRAGCGPALQPGQRKPHYGTENQVLGSLGIIGPKRIPYQRIIPLVDTIALRLSQTISKGP